MRQSSERGAVSIFIVVFTALLVTIVTTSFIQIMLNGQKQATNNDLSQSAYDSALAGVEDAKRALVKLKNCQGSSCETQVRDALNTMTCNSLQGAGVATFNSNGEVIVGDAALNQAYTCVKVQLDTDFVEGSLDDNSASVVRLGAAKAFNKIRLSWFSADDIPKLPDGTTAQPEFPMTDPTALPTRDSWSERQPPVIRSQLIQFKKGAINLDSFNATKTNNAKTLFFFPIQTNSNSTANFSSDTRRDSASRNVMRPASCNTTDVYACSVTIDVPNLAGVTDREAYLQLASYYNKASFKIELLNGSTIVPFEGVQPIVDSTGRASDLFRRVKASVSVSDGGSSFEFPSAALSVTGNLCKDFFVTDNINDYQSNTDFVDCDPSATP